MSLTQIFLTGFLIFALSRVYLRFRDSEVPIVGLFFWGATFSSAIVGVLFPDLTTKIAQALGIGRGVDAVVYTSIALLFYLVFRLYVYLEDLRHDVTSLVRKLALEEKENEKERKSAKN